MCYSANASFTAGAFLSVVASATVRKALRHDRSMLYFALFPAIFAVHQFIEGGVWLTLDGPGDAKIFRYSYISIAFLVWPTLSPLAAHAANRNRRLRPVFWLWLGMGLATTAYLGREIAGADGIEVIRVGHSLSYRVAYSVMPPWYIDYIYAITAIIPLVLLNNIQIRVFGIVLGISFVYSFLELREVYFSVWCLTAALSSTLVYFSIPPGKRAVLRLD